MTERLTERLTERSSERPGVRRILVTAIKGFAISDVRRVTLGADGAIGDRDFFVVDANGALLSVTRTGAFVRWQASFDADGGSLTLKGPDGEELTGEVVLGEPRVVDFWGSRDVAGHVVVGPWASWLSDLAGQPVTLVRTARPGGAFDERPVTVLSEASVRDVAAASGESDIDARRFRMLLTVGGVEAYEEETWQGREVAVGSALLRMRGPVPRCVATTYGPDTGTRDLKTLKLIAAARGVQPNEFGQGLNLGVYAEVVEPGVVAVGDTLEV